MNLKIAICDDDTASLKKLESIASLWANEKSYKITTKTFPSAEAFLFDCDNKNIYDILLLDVEMKDISGIDLAKKIRLDDKKAEIIFTTSHTEFISEGYEVDALHYLIKPLSEEKLKSVLDKAAEKLSAEAPSLIIQCDGEFIKINEEDIIYLESLGHYVCIHTQEKEYNIKEKLSYFEEKLSESFFKTHRSYIVSLKKIIRISKTSVILEGDIEIPISRKLYDDVNRAFIKNN